MIFKSWSVSLDREPCGSAADCWIGCCVPWARRCRWWKDIIHGKELQQVIDMQAKWVEHAFTHIPRQSQDKDRHTPEVAVTLPPNVELMPEPAGRVILEVCFLTGVGGGEVGYLPWIMQVKDVYSSTQPRCTPRPATRPAASCTPKNPSGWIKVSFNQINSRIQESEKLL